TLGQWLERQAFPVPVRQAARLVAIVAEAVQHAHDRGVLHRDLKPNNIILQPVRDDPLAEQPPAGACQLRGEYFIPRVVDFGLAKLMERGEPSDTHTWQILGTPKYMAPEQALARHSDLGPAADVYALGAILYELLTGCAPFDGATDMEVLRQVIDGRLTPPRQHRPDIPRDLEAICLKAMEKNPARRYRTAIDLADDLRRFLDGKPTIARPLNALGRFARWARRNDQLVALIIVSTIAVIMIGVGTWYMGETRRLKNDQERVRSDLEHRVRLERQRDYARYVHLAYLSLRSGNRAEASDYLDAARLVLGSLQDTSDFPYRYLQRLVQLPRWDIPTYKSRVAAVALTPTRHHLCWLYRDGTATLWDIQQGGIVHTWTYARPPAESATWQAAFVGAQQNLLLVYTHHSGTGDVTATLWRIEPGQPTVPLKELPPIFQQPWVCCTTSADGRYSCLQTPDGLIRCWDWYQQAVTAQTLLPHPARLMALQPRDKPLGEPTRPAAHPVEAKSGWEVVLCGQDDSLWRWNGQAPPQRLPPLKQARDALAVAVSPDGQVGVGTSDGLWTLDNQGRWHRLLAGPVRWLFATPAGWLAASRSGRLCLCQEQDLWEWSASEQGEITLAALDHSGQLLCTVADDGFIRTWRIPDDCRDRGVYRLPEIQRLVSSGESARWIVLTSHRPYYHGGQAGLSPISPLPPVTSFHDAYLTRQGTVHLVRTEGPLVLLEQWEQDQQRRLLKQWRHPQGSEIVYARWLLPPAHLFLGDAHGRVYQWDLNEPARDSPRPLELHLRQPLTQAAINPDATLLALRLDRSTIGIWSLTEQQWKTTLRALDAIDFCFVDTPPALATAGEGGAIRLWSLESGRETAIFWGHAGAVTVLTPSPDQRTLVSGGANGEVIFWDLRAQREVFRQRRHDGPVRHVAFVNQGQALITATTDQIAWWTASE
ncbi:MAG: serine/threonine-protein kinase, partial [Gemmataceae bacterium]|nr:serine/threonine-protein kinase [Gemmataceae bacterium]